MAECSKCGRCCEYIFAEMPPPEMLVYWGLRNCLFFPELNVMLIPCPCNNLLPNHTCYDYEHRPKFCRENSMPPSVMKALKCSLLRN